MLRPEAKSPTLMATSTPRPPTDKGAYVREMFARIAPRHDATNRVMTAGMDERWRRRAIALLAAPQGGTILDLCCGTGDVVFHLLRTDPSRRDRYRLAPDARWRPARRAQTRSDATHRRRRDTFRFLTRPDGATGFSLQRGRHRRGLAEIRRLKPARTSSISTAAPNLIWKRAFDVCSKDGPADRV